MPLLATTVRLASSRTPRAALDRYGIIHDFFKVQLINRPVWATSQRRPVPFQLYRSLHDSRLSSSPNAPRNDSDEHPDPKLHYSRFFQRLAASVPHLHRPTRDDFLAVANGFWQRARIRFKWFTIKSFRKFNADDISGFITWFLMSQTVWILVGT